MLLKTLHKNGEVVLIVGDNYKTYRDAAVMFKNRHPDEKLHHATIGSVMKKFRKYGNVDNKLRKKHESWIVTEDIQN